MSTHTTVSPPSPQKADLNIGNVDDNSDHDKSSKPSHFPVDTNLEGNDEDDEHDVADTSVDKDNTSPYPLVPPPFPHENDDETKASTALGPPSSSLSDLTVGNEVEDADAHDKGSTVTPPIVDTNSDGNVEHADDDDGNYPPQPTSWLSEVLTSIGDIRQQPITSKRKKSLIAQKFDEFTRKYHDKQLTRAVSTEFNAFQTQFNSHVHLKYLKSQQCFIDGKTSYTEEEMRAQFDSAFVDVKKALGYLKLEINPIGAPADPAPRTLRTKLRIKIPATGQYLCLGYSKASVMDYIGHSDSANLYRDLSWTWSTIPLIGALSQMESLMEMHVPSISTPVIYGYSRHGQSTRHITVEQVFNSRACHPWLVIPTTSMGGCSHAFWVIDDIVIDTATPYALTRTMDTARWLFENEPVHLHVRQYMHPSNNKSVLQSYLSAHSSDVTKLQDRKFEYVKTKRKTRRGKRRRPDDSPFPDKTAVL